MEFRILKNEVDEFKVQRKGWLFWHDVSRYDHSIINSPKFPLIVKTREQAEKIIEECQHELCRTNWRVVGGKVLPPRPWPAPPEKAVNG